VPAIYARLRTQTQPRTSLLTFMENVTLLRMPVMTA